jgi:hypothetical protein
MRQTLHLRGKCFKTSVCFKSTAALQRNAETAKQFAAICNLKAILSVRFTHLDRRSSGIGGLCLSFFLSQTQAIKQKHRLRIADGVLFLS